MDPRSFVRFAAHFCGMVLRSFILFLRFPTNRIRIAPSARVPWRCSIRAFRGDEGHIVIGANCWIEEYARIGTYGGSVELGRDCSVNDFTVIRGGGGVRIGAGVHIGPHCVLSGISHSIDRVDIPICEQGKIRRPIVIEDDVWIGASVTVLDGVTIGRGAVIGAGSVVIRPIPAYAVAVGNPARVVRMRTAAEPVPANAGIGQKA